MVRAAPGQKPPEGSGWGLRVGKKNDLLVSFVQFIVYSKLTLRFDLVVSLVLV